MKPMHKIITCSLTARVAGLSIILILALAAAAAAQQAPGLDAKRLADATGRYDAASWPAGPARAGLPVLSLSFDGYTGGPVDFSPRSPAVRRFADEDGVDRFLVEVSARETAAEARTVLLEYLASVSSPNLVPTASSLDIPAGDIGFVGRAPEKRIAWIAFIRGNVAIRVACLDPRSNPHPEMDRIATAVDRLILDQPLRAAGETAARITFTSFTTSRRSCRAGEAIPLQLQLNGSPAAFNWVVGGPGQGYVERDKSGAWILHTTKEGVIDLTCHILGAYGYAASKTVSIEVGAE